MKDQPLQSGEQSKIIIFSVFLLPSIVFLVGIIPAIFIAFGIYMMKKNNDFIHIEAAVKSCRIYCYVAFFVGISMVVILGGLYSNYENSDSASVTKLEDGSTVVWVADMDKPEFSDKYDDEIKLLLATLFIPVFYLILLNSLFYAPLYCHKDWVEKKGIFATKKTKEIEPNAKSVDIIKSGKLKPYSVSDELLKWVKLKEDGHVSEQEYEQARKKLLGDI